MRPASPRLLVLAPVALLAWASTFSVATAQDNGWPMAGGDAAHTGTTVGPAPPYRLSWESELGQQVLAPPVASGGSVVIVGRRGVLALEAGTGDTRWEVARPEGPTGAAAIAGGAVIFATGKEQEAAVVAVELEDGAERWEFPTESPVQGGITAEGSTVYAGGREGSVFAIAAKMGEERWRFDARGRVEGPPAVAEGLVFVVSENVSDGETAVHALDAETGQREWRFSEERLGARASAVSVRDGTAFVGLGDFSARALDAANGVERWSAQVRVPFGSRAVPAVPGDLVIADLLGHIYRLAQSDGTERWVFRVPGGMLASWPAVSGGSVIVADGSGRVSAIELDSGLLAWKRDLGQGRALGTAVTSDRLYVATRGGKVVALENDPEGVLLKEESPTTLFAGRALLNFAAAAAAALAALLLLFRVLGRGRR